MMTKMKPRRCACCRKVRQSGGTCAYAIEVGSKMHNFYLHPGCVKRFRLEMVELAAQCAGYPVFLQATILNLQNND